tara:strand:- start:231 stop:668 length:438 start_codon:yes stop_codon:yes gene_type:complete
MGVGLMELPSGNPCAHLADHGGLVREFAGTQFRIDEFAVNCKFKRAPIGGFEFEAGNATFVFSENLAGQTDRLWFVVSRRAVAKVNFHWSSSIKRVADWLGFFCLLFLGRGGLLLGGCFAGFGAGLLGCENTVKVIGVFLRGSAV